MAKNQHSRDLAHELVNDGIVSAEDMLTACLKYMSLADVQDMLASNDFIPEMAEDTDSYSDDYDDTY
jgi:hypothetical protein